MDRRSRLIVLLLASAVLLATPSAATTISITGLAGAAGTDGADGNPGGDGTDGGDGQDVTAVADTPGENNIASATGGAGGAGGDGGDGVPAGADGGDAGDGGSGGDATARAIGSGASSVSAAAVWGDGGSAGSRGSASQPGVAGEFGVTGVAGAALAEATLDTDLASLATASATAGENTPFFGTTTGPATAVATVANAGGGAQSTATAYSAVSDAASTAIAAGAGTGAITANATTTAIYEGDATATARGSTEGAGRVTVSATAKAGGNLDRSASATAYGSNAGSGPVVVTSFASNLSGAVNTAAGELTSIAEGHSTGGGDVTVEAYTQRVTYSSIDALTAPESVMHDVVRGSTSGHLTLRQLVNFSPTGLNSPPAGGVNTSLHATNPGGGALSADVAASGGLGADLVLGDILASSITGADVDIDVRAGTAPGGNGIFQENRDGVSPPTPSRIHAESNGGSVRTSVLFSVYSTLDSSDGSSIEMVDVATGDTTGALKLEQNAQAGPGAPGSVVIPAGSGGNALSSLTKDTSSSSLELRSEAVAGPIGFVGAISEDSRGGNGTALVSGSNSSGSARVFARARGGDGGSGPAGNAVAESSASTTGDGHEVLIGQEIAPNSFPEMSLSFPLARGGDVVCRGCAAGSARKGGDAASRSIGSATGDSLVTVWDLAIGGTSRAIREAIVFGSGGDATSTAIAQGGGVSTVKAKSEARGGEGGGNADATSTGSGLGRVESWARAVAGSLRAPLDVGGSAIANATAEGASGFARAEAISGLGQNPRLRAQSEAQIGSQRDVAAAAAHGAALASAPADAGLEGRAFFTSAPLQVDVDTALAGNAAMAQSFAGGAKQMLALAHWSADAGDGPLDLSTDLELELNTAPSSRPLALGAFGVSLVGDGFESLSFSLSKNGAALGAAQTFATADELLAFFTNTLLDLGTGWKAGDKLLAHFDLALGTGTRVEMGLAYAVPEPGTALLLVLGLILIAIYRLTSNPAAMRSHVFGPTPRSRSANFCTRPVGVCGRSSTISR